MFGTDGIRATVGNAPFTTPDLHKMGLALGSWIIKKYGENATVLIGHDTRLSCSFVKSSLKSGLLAHPVCLIDAGVLPTPAVVQLALNHETISCGIIISASHNPYQDNGIKIIDGTKGKLSAQDEQDITDLFYRPAFEYNYSQLGEEHFWGNAQKTYSDHIKSFFCPDFLRNKKVVLDCANGAAFDVAPALFRHFGAEVIAFAHEPNGKNINVTCGAVHPEALQRLVLEHHADAGFAFDGDSDRVIAVNHLGEIRDGDDILALLLDHPLYKNTRTIVGTIMTNQGLESWLNLKNITLLRTPVGDKYIARRLDKDGLLIGGEQSGHIILKDYLPTGDGIFTALRIMESIANNNDDMKTFNRFPQILINIPVKNKKDLTQEPFANMLKLHEEKLSNGRLVVRYSGTESILRIMIENDNKTQAEEVAQTLASKLQLALQG
jgi:phosphoglucosamine mutase